MWLRNVVHLYSYWAPRNHSIKSFVFYKQIQYIFISQQLLSYFSRVSIWRKCYMTIQYDKHLHARGALKKDWKRMHTHATKLYSDCQLVGVAGVDNRQTDPNFPCFTTAVGMSWNLRISVVLSIQPSAWWQKSKTQSSHRHSVKWYMVTGTTPKSDLRSRHIRHIPILIRSDTNFLHRPQISALSEIKTPRNRINYMRLTSPKVHLSKTIHDWLRSLRIVPYRAIIYAFFQQTRPNYGCLVQFCKQYIDRRYACLDAIKELFTKLDQVTVIWARLLKNV